MIKAIITHWRAHLDELLGILLLKEFGEDMYSGVSSAPVHYWKREGTLEELMASLGCKADEAITIGVGGGKYDEHPGETGGKRKAGECAATLVARDLGVEGNPGLSELLAYAAEEDLHGRDQKFGLASIVKMAYEEFPDNADVMADYLMNCSIRPLVIHASRMAIENLRAGFEESIRTEEVFNERSGKWRTFATISSDDQALVNYCRSGKGGRAAMIIVKSPTIKQVRVLATKYQNVGRELEDIVRMIRTAERNAAKVGGKLSVQELGAEGSVKGAERWHYFVEGQMFLNGSLTTPGMPPTELPLETIQGFVRSALAGSFEPSRDQELCRIGQCSDRKGDPCPRYRMGLSNCRSARHGLVTILAQAGINYSELCKLYP